MNINQAILFGEGFLAKQGIEDPKWNSERLLLIVLSVNRASLYTELQRDLADSELQQYQALLEKRAEHYPLAYLEGTQEFYGRTFHLDPSVLIPRPETEEIIRAALELPLRAAPRIIDLGAGSGCLAVTLLNEISNSRVVALEYSSDAFNVLRKNAGGDVLLVRGNLYITPFLPESFDLVVSNPPYVEQGTELPAETKWEPSLALVTESLQNIYDNLLLQALRILKPGGYVVAEFGFEQEGRIQRIIDTHPEFHLLQIRKDYRDLPRIFILQKAF